LICDPPYLLRAAIEALVLNGAWYLGEVPADREEARRALRVLLWRFHNADGAGRCFPALRGDQALEAPLAGALGRRARRRGLAATVEGGMAGCDRAA
jgi:hypothetical protein